jgi:hypothetical protein
VKAGSHFPDYLNEDFEVYLKGQDRWSRTSLPVAIANLITALTACMSGFHLISSDGAFPPKKYDQFPIFVCELSTKISRCAVHFLHRNRKCSTVSAAWPYSHKSDSTTLSLWRKPVHNF